eukprot:2583322-Pleurochrysis_carterae.AAC.2
MLYNAKRVASDSLTTRVRARSSAPVGMRAGGRLRANHAAAERRAEGYAGATAHGRAHARHTQASCRASRH